MRRSVLAVVCQLVIGFILCSPSATAMGLNPAFDQDVLGPEHSTGVIVWNHGRSLTVEDSESPMPPFLRVLREGGWDVLRFDRPRDSDTLIDSTRRLIDHVAELKHKGYRRVALAGQSFGAFLALMAADASDDVDAVVATAPAAFGSFDEFYESWRLNAIRLYPLLERVRRARVMLFFFHGDDFDPGGRGERSRAILAERGLGFAVVDQPAFLVGHWASSTGLFLRRFGRCIRDFLDADTLLLEYTLGETRSYLWAVTTDSIDSVPLARGSVIEAAARETYALLTARMKTSFVSLTTIPPFSNRQSACSTQTAFRCEPLADRKNSSSTRRVTRCRS